MSAPEAAAKPRRWFLDWRVWLGIAITVVAIWYAARGVPLAEVTQAMARADLLLLLVLSIPAHVLSIYIRALRWRHLTNPIAPIGRSTLYRAQSIGFAVNNLVPLRIGELVRSWYLARQSGTRGAAILGTVVLERALDVVSVLLMAGGGLAYLGASAEEGGLLAEGARLLVPAACVPLIGLIVLRLAPDSILRLVRWGTSPLPERVREGVVANLRRFTEGLGALSGGSHLLWILFHSLVLWLVVSVIPVLAGFLAFGIDLGSPERLLVISWILLAGVGVAVAVPSAPGFFGTYQLAFTAVLVPFGVDAASALALGLVVWFVFWTTFTLNGLVALRTGGVTLGELTRQPR